MNFVLQCFGEALHSKVLHSIVPERQKWPNCSCSFRLECLDQFPSKYDLRHGLHLRFKDCIWPEIFSLFFLICTLFLLSSVTVSHKVLCEATAAWFLWFLLHDIIDLELRLFGQLETSANQLPVRHRGKY